MSNVVSITERLGLIVSEPEDFGYIAEDVDAEILRLGVDGIQREWHLPLDMATRWYVTAGGSHLKLVAS